MIAVYTYRACGLRHTKTVNGFTTTHVWNFGSIVLERNASGAVVNRFHRGLGHLISSDHHGYYLFNVRGDVIQRVDSAGNIIHTYRYDAFGNEQNQDAVNTNPFRFAGEYYDFETGFIYLRARFYNPVLGRFISEDPHWNIRNMIFGNNPVEMSHGVLMPDIHAIMQAGNLYVFCINNPIMWHDASGEFIKKAVAAACVWVAKKVGPALPVIPTIPKIIERLKPPIQKVAPGVAQPIQNVAFATSQRIPNSQALFHSTRGHIFSQQHINDGIMRLGNNQVDIFNRLINTINLNRYSSQIVSGSNQIHTRINGVDVTIRFFVHNGEIINLNAFVGHAERVIGKLHR